MRFSQTYKAIITLSLLVVLNLVADSLSPPAHAQTAVTGALSGSVTASAAELKSDTFEVTVILGTTSTADIKVTPTATSTVVEVKTSDLPLVDTQNAALAATFTEQQIQDLPAPG